MHSAYLVKRLAVTCMMLLYSSLRDYLTLLTLYCKGDFLLAYSMQTMYSLSLASEQSCVYTHLSDSFIKTIHTFLMIVFRFVRDRLVMFSLKDKAEKQMASFHAQQHHQSNLPFEVAVFSFQLNNSLPVEKPMLLD